MPETTLKTLEIDPQDDIPLPYNLDDEEPDTLLEELAVAGNTAELQKTLGASLGLSAEDLKEQTKLIDKVAAGDKTPLTQPVPALAAAAFIREYGRQKAIDVAAARAAVTNKLMEIANCGDVRYELKALELLGKHSDIGIFTERSEVTIRYQDPEKLEEEIKARVKRLLNATVIDEVPLEASLDELEDIEFEEILPEPTPTPTSPPPAEAQADEPDPAA